jgi:hypothetical protein
LEGEGYMRLENYSYKVEEKWDFLGKPRGKVFFGIELEMESSCKCWEGNDDCKCIDVSTDKLDALSGGEFLGFKTDSSLFNGVEIVTVPASLEIHRRRWKGVFENWPENLIPKKSCGMHIHASKEPLTPEMIGRIWVFVNKVSNRKILTTLAGRAGNDYCEYLSVRKNDFKDKFGNINDYFSSHHSAVDIDCPKTIEFRMFAGTNEYLKFIRNLEFVSSLIHWVRLNPKLEYDDLSWVNLFEYISSNKSWNGIYEFLKESHK